MNKKCTSIFALVLILMRFTIGAGAQGCSDAGFSSLNSMKPNIALTTAKTQQHSLKFGISTGRAEYDISILGNYLDYSWRLNDSISFNARILSQAQFGALTKSFGISDMYLSTNYAVAKELSITAGLKIPLGNGNSKKAGMPLPMDYQSSLGTADLLLGAGYRIDMLYITLTIQQPFIQNRNSFYATNYPDTSAFSLFQSTKDFIRMGDVSLRVSYLFPIDKKFIVTPSLMPIWHLANDKYANQSGVIREIGGSRGITININLFAQYKINKSHSVELSSGVPLLTRRARPEGLARKFVATIEYSYSF